MAEETKRVELSDGGWAEVRTHRFDVADLRNQRADAVKRGFEDKTLDGLAVLKGRIVAWSFGEVTDEAINQIALDDAMTLLGVVNGSDDGPPNSSSSSRRGTRRSRVKSATTEENRPGNG